MMEITEDAVNYVRKTIASRMGNKYENWYKDVEITRNTIQSKRLNSILDFVQTGVDGLHFSSSNFKIQSDYNEELRESNSKIMNIVSERSKFFLGGSADLSSSCHTSLYKDIDHTKKERTGRNINFGVREHAMGAVLNGMALTGLRVYGSTFLAFADYLKPALRMTAQMNLRVTYIFTHD